jgi:hypothetical protein
MSATDNMLFHIDQIVSDGKPIAFEDGSGTLSGAARYENEVVPSASGDDFEKRKRVPTLFKCKIQFGPAVSPKDYAKMQGIQITARDAQSGRRALMPKCSFGQMGDVGGGSVDVTFNVLAEIQWL